MKHQKKFAYHEQQQVSEIASVRTTEQEFASVEEMLRFDAKQTGVPPEILRRLNQSAAKEPPASPRPWWKRFLGINL